MKWNLELNRSSDEMRESGRGSLLLPNVMWLWAQSDVINMGR